MMRRRRVLRMKLSKMMRMQLVRRMMAMTMLMRVVMAMTMLMRVVMARSDS